MFTKHIKVLSIVTTILGMGVTLVSEIINSKKLEQLVVKEVENAIAKRV